jgi:hypothetical protein
MLGMQECLRKQRKGNKNMDADDGLIGFVFGFILGGILIGFAVNNGTNKVWEKEAIKRGYGHYVLPDTNSSFSEFQWITNK